MLVPVLQSYIVKGCHILKVLVHDERKPLRKPDGQTNLGSFCSNAFWERIESNSCDLCTKLGWAIGQTRESRLKASLGLKGPVVRSNGLLSGKGR